MNIFYVNPMSYANIAIYDYSLLKNIPSYVQITYWGSYLYDYKQEGKWNFIPVFRYNKISSKIPKVISYLFSLIIIYFAVLKHKPDVIHIQWIRAFWIDYFFLLLLLTTGTKVIYTAHNLLPHNDIQRASFRHYQLYYKKITSIIVHSQNSKKELIDDFQIAPEKIEVIKHGIITLSINETFACSLITDLTKKYNLKKKIVFSILGLQSYYKGVDFVIDLWSRDSVFRNNSNIHLFIGGKRDNVDFSSLKGLNNVTVIDGHMSSEMYIALSRLSSVLLLPYRKISQSGVLFSAIDESIPVLVSHVGGLTDPLKVAKIGWDMGKPTYENFSQIMHYLITNENEIHEVKNDEESWKKVKDQYSWNTIGKKTADLYMEL